MKRSGWWLVAVVAFCGVLLIRPRLVADYERARETSDSYALPPPEQLVVMSLGYRSAFADFIYAHVLVSYGLHFQHKRRFEYVGHYLDAITTLDPKFAQPYLYADTLLTLQPVPARHEDYLKARDILLKGTRELPYHQRVWFTAGQYLAYLAPPYIDDENEREALRTEGARLLSRACELMTDNANIPYHCLTAAGILNRAGERDALIQMLTRTLAVNDDEEIRRRALAALSKWVSEQQHDVYARRLEAFGEAWQKDLSFLSKEKLLLLGPSIDVMGCAGPERNLAPNCRVDWRGWAEAHFGNGSAIGASVE